jgi:2-methylcitrate dehydratase PrpD
MSSRDLAAFAAGLQLRDVPPVVVDRAIDFIADWFGSALAGRGARAVESIAGFARSMGPANGPSEILISRGGTTPLFAAQVNAAASHVIEQDDVHNGSVFHPATVVISPALAVAQAVGCSGADLLTAVIAGYEVGIRVGEFLGRSHYTVFHTTGTAGTVAAAAAVGRLLTLSPEQMLDAIGSAGTQAAGLWEFLCDAADSKQLHTAHAAGAGLTSAYLARDGFRGARRILEGRQGMAAGMSRDARPERLTDGLGERWALAETSFKYHASCRHTHPAADALLAVMQENNLAADHVAEVVAQVHQGAIDVLGAVDRPETVHQAKFSMGTVLGLVALDRRAAVADFETALGRPEVDAFRRRVRMQLDPEVDAAYPARWIGKVAVTTTRGEVLAGRVDVPKGDPGNSLSRAEITEKVLGLARFSAAASEAEVRRTLDCLWALRDVASVGRLLPERRVQDAA